MLRSDSGKRAPKRAHGADERDDVELDLTHTCAVTAAGVSTTAGAQMRLKDSGLSDWSALE